MSDTPGWQYFDPTTRVQSWVAGENSDGSTGLSNGAQNEGFLLTSTSSANLVQLTSFESSDTSNWPYLAVTYSPRTGTAAPLDIVNTKLTDMTNLGVNVANGNAIVDTTDFNVPGVGLPMSIDHLYNSLGSSPTGLGTASWSLSDSADGPYIEYLSGSAALVAADNETTSFLEGGGGNYSSPPGINAPLYGNPGSSYTLTYHQSQEVLTFDAESGNPDISLLASVKDRNGNTITYTYNSSNQLTQIQDTEGRDTTLSWSGSRLSSITDSAGQQATFSYNTNGQLSSVSYEGATSDYSYDASGNLTEIVDPIGNITTMAYDASHRITSLTRVTNDATLTGPTTQYSYSPGSASSPNSGQTVVEDPNGNDTTYNYDPFDRVTSVTDALGHRRSATYSPNSDVSTSTDALSNVTSFSYDTLNNLP